MFEVIDPQELIFSPVMIKIRGYVHSIHGIQVLVILYDGCIVNKADLLLFTHLAHCFTVFRQFLPERMLLYGIVRRGEDRIDINLCFREAFAQFIDPGAKVPGVLLAVGHRPRLTSLIP